MAVSQCKRELWPVREGSGSYKHIKSRFSPSQLIRTISPHLMSSHRVSWMDVTRLVLNQRSLCSQSPFDLHVLEWPEMIRDLVECGCEGLVDVRYPVAIYNFSRSSFLVPKLAIKRFNWPWNVGCKLWLEKTRDSKVIFYPNLALTCHAFFSPFLVLQGFFSSLFKRMHGILLRQGLISKGSCSDCSHDSLKLMTPAS